jgi:hypothetical protein
VNPFAYAGFDQNGILKIRERQDVQGMDRVTELGSTESPSRDASILVSSSSDRIDIDESMEMDIDL